MCIRDSLWTTKTRIQLEGGGLVHTARAIVAENGVKGLYRGLKASYWGLSEGALQFFLYEKAKRVMTDANARADGSGELRSWQYLAAAGGSKGIASLATYPHEVVRTRMREAGSARYQKMLQSLALIAREEGAKGLYGGLGPHLLRVVPNTAIMFMSFEVLSKSLPGIVEQRAWEKPLAQGRRAVQCMYGKAREVCAPKAVRDNSTQFNVNKAGAAKAPATDAAALWADMPAAKKPRSGQPPTTWAGTTATIE